MTAGAVATGLAWLMLVIGPITLASGLYLQLRRGIAAPYGRYSISASTAWGPQLPGRVAWMVQECPSLLVPLLVLAHTSPGPPHLLLPQALGPCGVLSGAFLLHYAYRSLVYPLQVKAPKGTPLLVFLLAFTFTCWNGFIQGWFMFRQCPSTSLAWQRHHVLGVACWLVGWLLNLQCDSILRNLRSSPRDQGYYIPRGSLFEYVSAANYTAECMEWAGWALACWSLAPAAFALYTFCNLAPRALSHHQWYLDKFKGEYPCSRKVIIPFLW